MGISHDLGRNQRDPGVDRGVQLNLDLGHRARGRTRVRDAGKRSGEPGLVEAWLESALRVVSGEISILRSENEFDWLGNGIYYWEYAPKQAWAWADRKRKNEHWPRDEEVAVVASMIRLGFCFDLLDPDNTHEIKACYREYLIFCERLGQEPRKNYQHRKYLDCAVFQLAYAAFKRDGIQVDSSRSVYVPTGPRRRAWKSSSVSEDAHIQLCIRNDDCILGSWLAKPR